MAKIQGIPKTLSEYAELVNTNHGAGTMVRATEIEQGPRLPTGVFAADFMLGGGLPLNQSAALVGPEHGGKTSLLMNVAAMVPRICWRCWEFLDYCTCSEPADKRESVFLDVEGKLDLEWATAIFNDAPLESMFVDLPSNGEEAGDLAEAYLCVENCGLVCIDSLAAILPDPEMGRSFSEKGMMEQPQLISRIIRKLKSRMIRERKAGHRVSTLFTNQIRLMTDPKQPFLGPQETEPGGMAAKFDFSVKVRVNKLSVNKDLAKKYADTERPDAMRVQKHSIISKKTCVTPLAGSGEFLRIREPMSDKGLHKGAVDDHWVCFHYGQHYDVFDKTAEGWGDDVHRERTQDDLIAWWKENPVEYLRAQRRVIATAKEVILAR